MLWGVWIGLAVLVLALAGGGAFAGTRALTAYRRFRSARRELLGMLASVEERAVDASEKAGRATRTPALSRSLSRLEESTRRLNVLRSALDEAGEAWGRLTAVYPRK